MPKKHIISFGYRDYAVDSITAATQAVALLSKLKPVRFTPNGDSSGYHYAPIDDEERYDVKLELNQNYREPKPVKESKALALPKPKRGTILCICEKSYVAPKESCPSCGRNFSESHSRTHSDKSTSVAPILRLL